MRLEGIIVALAMTVVVTGCSSEPEAAGDVPAMKDLVADVRAAVAKHRTATFEARVVEDVFLHPSNGELRYDAESSDMWVVSGSPGADDEFMYVDDVVYLSLDSGGGWLSLAPKVTGNPAKLRDEFLEVVEGADPGTVLELLSAAGKVAAKSPAKLDGVGVTRYRIVLDLKAVEALVKGGGPDTQMLRDLVSHLKYGPPTTQDADLWVDAEGLIRRFEIPERVSYLDTGSDFKDDKRMVVSYSDWGAKVDIAAPPREDVEQP